MTACTPPLVISAQLQKIYRLSLGIVIVSTAARARLQSTRHVPGRSQLKWTRQFLSSFIFLWRVDLSRIIDSFFDVMICSAHSTITNRHTRTQNTHNFRWQKQTVLTNSWESTQSTKTTTISQAEMRTGRECAKPVAADTVPYRSFYISCKRP